MSWYEYQVSAPTTGLARVTISSPLRRVDVALPEAVPLAEVLPELLRHAGEGLADDGERHGGWLLRRADGVSLSPAATLASQGVRDGAVLHLVPARAEWPELEYDDVVEAIAAGARRQGLAWTPGATRAMGIVAAGACLFVALVAIWIPGGTRQYSAFAALAVAALLVTSGVITARAYGDALVGAAVAALALPFGFFGGLLVVVSDVPFERITRAELALYVLVGSMTLLLISLVAAVGVGSSGRVFVGGATAGLTGVVGALLAYRLDAAGAGAIVLSALVSGIGLVPLLAIRLGKLPMPVLTLPSGLASGGEGLEPQPDRRRVFAAVARTDEMLTGLLLGISVSASVACYLVGTHGGVAGRLLVVAASGAMLLRARLFMTVRQRLPLLCSGLAGFIMLGVGAITANGGGALLVVIMSTRFSAREPSPYIGRAGDILDVACVVSVIPIACAVLGLYGLARGVIG